MSSRSHTEDYSFVHMRCVVRVYTIPPYTKNIFMRWGRRESGVDL